MNTKRFLIINGSTRKKGTSFSFARTIKKLAEDSGNIADLVHSIDYFDKSETVPNLKEQIMSSDIIAIIAPLYADTLPYHDIWLLEQLATGYSNEFKGKGLFAIGQCGFPDITRIQPLLDACRFFAIETGMNWLGGLAYGGGAMLNGAYLEDLGKNGRKITSAFNQALLDIANNSMISPEVQEKITVKIPKLLYRPLAAYLNNNTKKLARQNGNADYKRKAYLK